MENYSYEFLNTKKTAKQKLEELKYKAKYKIDSAVTWCKNNPEAAVFIGSVVLAGGKYAIKQHAKQSTLRKQEEIKTLYIYDRSHGHYWPLRRELSTREYIEVDRRKDNGEKLRDILDDMRVLK